MSSQPPDTINVGSYGKIEELLLKGKREDAVQIAVQHKDWALAMLIAGNCKVETYQEVIKSYAEETFPTSSPMHFLSMLYSNQANSAVRCGGRKLNAFAGDRDDHSRGGLLWRKNLAALLSNKTPVWQELVTSIGDRLLIDEKVMVSVVHRLITRECLGCSWSALRIPLRGRASRRPRYNFLLLDRHST